MPHALPEQETLDSAPYALYDDGTKLAIPIKSLYRIYPLAASRIKELRLSCSSSVERLNLLRATSVVLLQSPEHATAMNCRRRLLLSTASIEREAAIDAELAFIALLFTIPANCKATPLWHHRRWVLQLRHSSQPALALPNPSLSAELRLTHRCCELYLRNYAAYSHRSILLNQMNVSSTANSHNTSQAAIWQEELQRTRAHLSRNPSDASASALIYRLHVALCSTRADVLVEVKDATETIGRYPQYQTSWLHLRRLVQLLHLLEDCTLDPKLHEEVKGLCEQYDVVSRDKEAVASSGSQTDLERERASRYAGQTRRFLLYLVRGSIRRAFGLIC